MASGNCLAIETGTARAGVAFGGTAGVFVCESHGAVAPSRRVYEWIDAVLRAGDAGLADVGSLAFGAGPGSFTGIRVAAAVAQALGYARGIPVWRVSTLAALAVAALRHSGAARAIVALDARMGGVYVGDYRRESGGRIVAMAPDRLAPADQALQLPAGGMVAAGPGFAVAPGLLRGRDGDLAVWPQLLPSARDVLDIACHEPGLRRAVMPADALPDYLRDRVTR